MARTVRDAMIADPPVLDAAVPLASAAQEIEAGVTDSAVVLQDGRPMGVVTGRELAGQAGADGDGAGTGDDRPVGDVCAPAAFVLRAEDPAAQAIQLMRKRDEAQLPVVDDGNVVGVVRLGDLVGELETGAGEPG